MTITFVCSDNTFKKELINITIQYVRSTSILCKYELPVTKHRYDDVFFMCLFLNPISLFKVNYNHYGELMLLNYVWRVCIIKQVLNTHY